MDAKKIKKQLIDLDLTVTDLARRAGYTREYTNRVLHGRYHSARAERRILAALASAQRESRAA